MKSPVLLITFNRPKHTFRVLSAIRSKKPQDLYVFQDGAREGNSDDVVRCAKVRKVIGDTVDWDCRLHTFFADKNYGCGAGPMTGINWFFSHVESGIVMEDDCLPHLDFFDYCDELLDRYKDDKKFFYNFGEVVTTLHKEYPEKPEKYLDIPDLSMKDAENKESEEEKEYALWVVSGGLALSYLDFVPDLFLRLQYMCDDLVFDFHVPELNIMMEDVMETFAHCRFQVYTATSYVSSIAEVAYSFSPMAKRIFNQELLLDIYPRLYSVLDKISHIVMKSCGITLSPNKDGYLPQPSYNQIVKEIRSHSDGNPYLLTLCEIFDEINPRYIYYKKKDQPFYAMLPEAEDMDRIRHHIVHSGISLTVEDSGKKSNKDICFITEREFAQRCHDLLCLVKEAIMNTCLAVEYRNRQE